MFSTFYVIPLVLSIGIYGNCQDIQIYSVPEPKIEVFPKGFRISIPDQDGINLFAFHGNINRPMEDLEAGQYSRDVLKAEDGHWVFENTMAKIKVGDVIYYWLFVIRFNLGYRYDNGKFVVKKISEHKSPQIDSGVSSPSSNNKTNNSNWYFEPLDEPNFVPHQEGSPKPPKASSSTHGVPSVTSSYNRDDVVTAGHKPISTCCQLFLNTTNQLSMLSEEMDALMEENKILMEIARKDDHYATTLKIFGKYPNDYYPTPMEFVQKLISEKMKLSGIKVVEAKTIPDNGISFKVETLKDKLKIVLAEAKLDGSNYDLSWKANDIKDVKWNA